VNQDKQNDEIMINTEPTAADEVKAAVETDDEEKVVEERADEDMVNQEGAAESNDI